MPIQRWCNYTAKYANTDKIYHFIIQHIPLQKRCNYTAKYAKQTWYIISLYVNWYHYLLCFTYGCVDVGVDVGKFDPSLQLSVDVHGAVPVWVCLILVCPVVAAAGQRRLVLAVLKELCLQAPLRALVVREWCAAATFQLEDIQTCVLSVLHVCPSANEYSAILFLLFARSSSNSFRSLEGFRRTLRQNFIGRFLQWGLWGNYSSVVESNWNFASEFV